MIKRTIITRCVSPKCGQPFTVVFTGDANKTKCPHCGKTKESRANEVKPDAAAKKATVKKKTKSTKKGKTEV